VAASLTGALADALDLGLASELAGFEVRSAGRRVDDAIVHDSLLVGDAAGRPREVAWRLVGGELHVHAGQLGLGLGRGRAWRDGRWGDRHRLTEEWLLPSLGRMREDERDLDEDDDDDDRGE
jgi:hypothetical protein